MPSLSRWLNSIGLKDQQEPGPSFATEDGSPNTTTTYFLAPFVPSDTDSPNPLILPIPSPRASQVQPPGSIHFGFSHPKLGSSPSPTAFFLTCLPDPIGYLAHSAALIRSHLGTGASGPSKWRHSQIHLVLEEVDGLAYTSAGRMSVSLKWVGHVEQEVQTGARDRASAVKEFKGVLLHELVHAIQYDGHGSTPIWLIESIADYVRLQARLGPPHWRHAGQGKKEKGYEDGYDAGAQLLSWLVGATGVEDVPQDLTPDSGLPTATPTATGTLPAPPQATQYPADPRPPGPAPQPKKGRYRPGPWPDLVKRMNGTLEHERYKEDIWASLTGHAGGLDGLWAAYLGHYI